MAHFIPKEDVSVNFYDGLHCSRKSSAELTAPHLIEKARANPDFEEVEDEIKAKRKAKKVAKKKAIKKKAK